MAGRRPSNLRGVCGDPAMAYFLLRGRDHNIPKRDVSLLASLQINRSRRPFIAIYRSASNTRNYLIVDDSRAILYDRDATTNEGDVIGLPLIGSSR